jgi:signal transduction histidine kinase
MMSRFEIFEKFLSQKSAIIYIETDADWAILKANDFGNRLFGKTLQGLQMHDFVVDFTEKINFDDLLKEPDKKHILNVNTASGLPQTYYFTFYQEQDTNYIFGETSSTDAEDLRKSFISLNNNLNNLTRELQKKNVQLNKLNDQKNEFIGMAAHDLRNPIGVIMGYSEFILDEAEGKLPEEYIKFLKIILSSSEFMLNMLNDLLDLTKIESGKLNLNKETIKPKTVINNNINLNRIIAEKKNITINVGIYEELPDIEADADKIEQVLNNLISNAIKFSNPGTTIMVSAFRSNGDITVAVKDEGQGISDQDKDNLFKPFSKLSSQSTSGEKSTGLGLSITKKIILGHGGKIWVESTPGKGTTFYFSLPIGKPV